MALDLPALSVGTAGEPLQGSLGGSGSPTVEMNVFVRYTRATSLRTNSDMVKSAFFAVNYARRMVTVGVKYYQIEPLYESESFVSLREVKKENREIESREATSKKRREEERGEERRGDAAREKRRRHGKLFCDTNTR